MRPRPIRGGPPIVGRWTNRAALVLYVVAVIGLAVFLLWSAR